MSDPASFVELLVEPDARHEIGKALRRRHLEMLVDDDGTRVVKCRQVKAKFEAAGLQDPAYCLEARLHLAALP